MMRAALPRRLVAEALGTALLSAIIVGSGIMAEALAQGNDAIALLGNTLASSAGLVVLIMIFGPLSGAHFNPAVTLCFLLRGEISRTHAAAYVLVQILSGLFGVALAHAMFDLEIVQTSMKARSGLGQALSEGVAAFGLILTVLGAARFRRDAVPYAIGLWIAAAYWFTSSTSFANPALTIARMFTATFAGVRPSDAPSFIAAQLLAALAATVLASWLFSEPLRLYRPADDKAAGAIQNAR